jgi:nitrogen regulatory protein PII 2
MVVVPDSQVQTVIRTVMEVNQTGNAGDGKIFVLPVLDAIRVRTKEKGDLVLDIDE